MAQASEIDSQTRRPVIATITPPPVDLNTINDSIMNLGVEITTTVTDGLNSTNTKFESWFDGLDTSVNTFGDFVKENGKTIKEVQQNSVETIDSVKDIASETKSITSSLGTVLSNVSGVASDMLSTVTTVYTMNELMNIRFDSLSSQLSNTQLGLATLIGMRADGIEIMLSSAEKKLTSAVDEIPTKLDSLFRATQLSTGSSSSDGAFTSLIKAMTRAVISPIEEVTKGIDLLFKVGSTIPSQAGSDGIFTRLIKGMTRAVISPIEEVTKGIDLLFKVGSTIPSQAGSDGIFTRLIKGMTRAVISPIEEVTKGIDLLFKVGSTIPSQAGSDGIFTQLIKGMTRAIINPINSIETVATEGFNALENALNKLDISNSFEIGWKQLSQDIVNLSNSFEAGLNGILDSFGALFIPSGSNVLNNVKTLGDTVNKKFPIIFAFPSFILGMFTPIQSDWFQAIEFSFMGVTTDFTGLSKPLTSTYVPIFRNIVELLLWLTLAVKCWKKVVVGSSVVGGSDDE
ncbi:hypothetical protein IW492_17470 [Enterococcus sp. BWB1-3]|uniref:hypothetical protein n=1 Tax=Enterococcus sp. BWB1-3 TaxID=2787713 RepID=UPI001924B98A|nr:hypothetical protein [Enterococcus sp. BWB1-3]MBL1231017.1 hypothetical protein [Enterococcus sp. BWB1-3]